MEEGSSGENIYWKKHVQKTITIRSYHQELKQQMTNRWHHSTFDQDLTNAE